VGGALERPAAGNDRFDTDSVQLETKYRAHGTDVHDTRFEQLLDSDEAASLLKIHPKTLQQMARSGEIAGVRIGKLWRFRASVLNAWLEHKMAS